MVEIVPLRGSKKSLDKIRRALAKTSSQPSLKVGFMAGSYPDRAERTAPEVAAFNEFGVPANGQPPRPFFRNMIAKHSNEWPEQVAQLLKANNNDGTKVLNLMGHLIVGQLQQSIRDTNAPPLAESTIRKKGHTKPLIDSGFMLDSVSFEVED